jgi:uncharacterized membrane protein YphA (DoxX/SURF4 family)
VAWLSLGIGIAVVVGLLVAIGAASLWLLALAAWVDAEEGGE